MTKTIIKLATAAALLAGTAQAAFAKSEQQSFERDGYTYVYTKSLQGKTTLLRGTYYPGGKPFALEVRNGRVEGSMNEAPVGFSLNKVPATNGALASAR
jgi:hypothetical protein